MFRTLSIRSKLLLMLLMVSFLSSIILIYIGYNSGKQAITQGNFDKLTSIRSSKQYQIESYFDNLDNIVESIGTNETTTNAIKNFKRGFDEISRRELTIECRKELSDHYEYFIGRLSDNLKVKPSLELFYPSTAAACYLQYEYIVNNHHAQGEKQELLDSKDNTLYNETHVRYHTYFKNIVEKFGFYDLFLVDLEKGNIVYSVYKETDFATNLYSGPYSESNLAHLARQLRSQRDITESKIVDFEFYRPSYGAPAAFMGIPMTENGITIGALILQLPVDKINQIMTGNGNWASEGLGESGETYLVGEDYMMRSVSRFFLEDSLGYREALANLNIDEEHIDFMFKVNTTILNQRVKTGAVESSMKGKTETKITEDYRGAPVLSSYAPLSIPGLKWSILSEQDLSETNKPVLAFQKKVFTTLFIILLLVSFLAMVLASKFVKPIEKLSEGVQKIKEGDFKHKIQIPGNDEIAILGRQFNAMIEDVDNKQKEIQQQSEENEALLLNFIPESIARRLQAGEQNIADSYSNVSLIVVDLIGFSKLTSEIKPEVAIRILNDLIDAMDTLAQKHQVEKLRTVGDTYFATCGLFNPRLDHIRRVLGFAFELKLIINQFNINHQLKLAIGIGVHTGDVTAGIVGVKQYSFDMLGTSVSTVFDLKEMAEPNSILVSQTVQEKLEGYYQFELAVGKEVYGEKVYECVSALKSRQ